MKLALVSAPLIGSFLVGLTTVAYNASGTLLHLKQIDVIEKQQRMSRPNATKFKGLTGGMMGNAEHRKLDSYRGSVG